MSMSVLNFVCSFFPTCEQTCQKTVIRRPEPKFHVGVIAPIARGVSAIWMDFYSLIPKSQFTFV